MEAEPTVDYDQEVARQSEQLMQKAGNKPDLLAKKKPLLDKKVFINYFFILSLFTILMDIIFNF